jgi:hypothetical protein
VPGQVDIGGNTGLLELSQTNLPPDTARISIASKFKSRPDPLQQQSGIVGKLEFKL